MMFSGGPGCSMYAAFMLGASQESQLYPSGWEPRPIIAASREGESLAIIGEYPMREKRLSEGPRCPTVAHRVHYPLSLPLSTVHFMQQHDLDLWHMRRALELAARGQGAVEPNPMVGCVIARGAEIIGEGWHRQFGADHAEVEALRMAGDRAAGATLYVTLEPCCHHGKTPPCTKAVLAAGVRRVVVAARDPFPQVQGGGIAELRAAGLDVELGLLETDARRLNAPYLKLVETGRPWIIAKWAMTLDGKIAARGGQSRWISNPQSREVVHKLRGRVDAILVGRGTAVRDDPLVDRPAARTAHRRPRGARHAGVARQRQPTRAHRGRSAGAGGRGARVVRKPTACGFATPVAKCSSATARRPPRGWTPCWPNWAAAG